MVNGDTYRTCGSFTKNKEKKQNFKETGDSWYIYQNKPDKAYFQHEITYGNFRGLPRRTASDKILHHKALILLKIQSMMDIKGLLLQCFIDVLIKSCQLVLLKEKLCATNN